MLSHTVWAWDDTSLVCILTKPNPTFAIQVELYNVLFSLQTNELVMSLEDDEKLILQDGLTLKAAGVGTSLPTISF